MEFEWDPAKERANIAKHRLDFQTAARVFLDPFLVELEDDRGYDELRWMPSAQLMCGCLL